MFSRFRVYWIPEEKRGNSPFRDGVEFLNDSFTREKATSWRNVGRKLLTEPGLFSQDAEQNTERERERNCLRYRCLHRRHYYAHIRPRSFIDLFPFIYAVYANPETPGHFFSPACFESDAIHIIATACCKSTTRGKVGRRKTGDDQSRIRCERTNRFLTGRPICPLLSSSTWLGENRHPQLLFSCSLKISLWSGSDAVACFQRAL